MVEVMVSAQTQNSKPTREAPASEKVGRSKRVKDIWNVLQSVTDPEIPVISVVEMGMIADVRIDGDRAVVDLTPTFAGCPAIDLIRREIREAVLSTRERDVIVNVVYDPPWSTDRISDVGRKKLTEFGLAPPRDCCVNGVDTLEKVECPFCKSTETDLESIFGPTLCRSIHYCRACLQSFEHFKSV